MSKWIKAKTVSQENKKDRYTTPEAQELDEFLTRQIASYRKTGLGLDEARSKAEKDAINHLNFLGHSREVFNMMRDNTFKSKRACWTGD